jgi:hypothetical protein
MSTPCDVREDSRLGRSTTLYAVRRDESTSLLPKLEASRLSVFNNLPSQFIDKLLPRRELPTTANGGNKISILHSCFVFAEIQGPIQVFGKSSEPEDPPLSSSTTPSMQSDLLHNQE